MYQSQIQNLGDGIMKNLAVILIADFILIGTVWAVRNEYTDRIKVLSDQILTTADKLKKATDGPVFNSFEIDGALAELKDLIKEYENIMVFAGSPYPGEILLATTPAGNDSRLEALCDTRYDGPMKEIRIRRAGSRANYLRINDIELTYDTPEGPKTETFNKNGRFRLYSNGVFQLALPKPMKIRRIRVNIEHESNGLQIFGIPYNLPVLQPRVMPVMPGQNPSEVLLGTTPSGDDAWLETLCSSPYNRPVREIQLKRTGREASYLRINDIEVTYMTPQGPKVAVFNKGGRFRLYYDGVFKLVLPEPMRIVRIRILIEHESTGLKVFGIY
jgi:hypothetical protein